MTFFNFRNWVVTAVAALVAAGSSAAWAEAYPSKAITLVVPFAAGSGTDQAARVYGKALSDLLKVPVVVDNKGGASGFIAAQAVAKAKPDGYTVFMTTNTTQVANPYLFKQIPYDPVKDFAPVELLFKGQMLLLVQAQAPYKTVSDLIAAAKRTPAKLSFGAGNSSSQVGGELFKQMADIDVLYVPYKSNPQAVTDLIGGQITFMFADAPNALTQLKGGKLRALATSSSKRIAAAPTVPTVSEAGIKGYELSYWTAVYVPAGTPASEIEILSGAFTKAAQAPEVKAFEANISAELVLGGPKELASFQAAEAKKWERVIKAAGIEPQ